MGLHIKRNLGPVTHLEKGEYTIETASGDPALCCPSCGEITDITCGVHAGGVVAEIFSCPCAACPFQSYLTLEMWGEAVLR